MMFIQIKLGIVPPNKTFHLGINHTTSCHCRPQTLNLSWPPQTTSRNMFVPYYCQWNQQLANTFFFFGVRLKCIYSEYKYNNAQHLLIYIKNNDDNDNHHDSNSNHFYLRTIRLPERCILPPKKRLQSSSLAHPKAHLCPRPHSLPEVQGWLDLPALRKLQLRESYHGILRVPPPLRG